MAKLTSAVITRYALVDNTTVLREKRKSAIPPKKPSKTQNGVSSNGMIGLHLEIIINKDEKITCPITAIPKEKLGYFMELFVIKIRKKDGSEYTSTTLHHLVAGPMHHLREADVKIDFFQDEEFEKFRKTLDSEMKRIRSIGDGTRKGKAEIITPEEKVRLWTTGTYFNVYYYNKIFKSFLIN